MVMTEESVEYGVLLVVVALGGPCCSCKLESLVLFSVILAGFYHYFGRDRFYCLWPSLDFVNSL